MMRSVVALILFVIGLQLCSTNATSAPVTLECHEENQCEHGNITQSEFNSSNIQCYGLKSCHSSKLILSVSDSNIECLGSYACYESKNLGHTHFRDNKNSEGDVICCGLSSCAEINNLFNKNGSIACDGELACAGSNINTNEGNLYCIGDKSCANSVINSTNSRTIISGHLGAQNSMFYSYSTTKETELKSFAYYAFDGVNSGDSATVICGKNVSCSITCHSNGCNNLELLCEDENDCNYDIKCTYAVKSDICPNGADYERFGLLTSDSYLMPNLNDITMTTYANSILECELSNTDCNDFEECLDIGTTLLANNSDTSPICCNGMKSCNNINSGMNLYSKTLFRCDGTMSCANMKNFSFINSIDSGNLYFTSYAAAFGTDIKIITTQENENFGENIIDIYCTGMESCAEGTIENVNNLYCTGGWSCNEAILIQNINNIWFFGEHSGAISTILNVDGSIYCGTQYTCHKSIMHNIGKDIYASGFNAAGETFISNVNGIVIGLGNKALYKSEIINASKLYCIGKYSCRYSVLRNIGTIAATYKHSLSDTVIISDRSNEGGDGILNLIVNGTNAGGFEVYCNETDTCNINCNSQSACKNVYLHCEGTCIVTCDEEDGYDCPIYIETDAPTIQPSLSPTVISVASTTSYVAQTTQNNKATLIGSTIPVAPVVTSTMPTIQIVEQSSTEQVNNIVTTDVQIIIDPVVSVTGAGIGGNGGNNNKDHDHDHDKKGCGKFSYYFLIFIGVIFGLMLGYYIYNKCCGNSSSITPRSNVNKNLYRATSMSTVIVNGNGTKTVGSQGEHESENSSSDRSSELSSSSGSSNMSGPRKNTEKASGES